MVTAFGIKREPICDFLLVNNNLILSRTIHKLLQIIGQFVHYTGGGLPISNTPVWGEPLNLGPQNLALKKLEKSFCRTVLTY